MSCLSCLRPTPPDSPPPHANKTFGQVCRRKLTSCCPFGSKTQYTPVSTHGSPEQLVPPTVTETIKTWHEQKRCLCLTFSGVQPGSKTFRMMLTDPPTNEMETNKFYFESQESLLRRASNIFREVCVTCGESETTLSVQLAENGSKPILFNAADLTLNGTLKFTKDEANGGADKIHENAFFDSTTQVIVDASTSTFDLWRRIPLSLRKR